MRCPFCAATETKVVETRENEDFVKRRRRECSACSKRFTTYERLEAPDVMIIKKSGSKQRYSRQKVLSGLQKSFEKRPVTEEKIVEVADSIEQYIRGKGLRELTSKKIGSLIMRRLKSLDIIAYIRFASVYKDFQDLQEFKAELEKLQTV